MFLVIVISSHCNEPLMMLIEKVHRILNQHGFSISTARRLFSFVTAALAAIQ